ncbi:hypothetical protein [Tersicoccus sp. Bi-70]|uniref:hypothetical protein n=1 Tax=Tersicoccus sp. Bi-70 TaxID=1897634 RepID=UPI000977BB1C|nr:hypothetical protein [Tersicoccus sp. Bi-70]OMH30635.1 hypothetical protein BGP79_11795 [Tersicoccus sp. Bi-70]
MADLRNVVLHLQTAAVRAEREAASSTSSADREFCEQRAAEFVLAAAALEQLAGQPMVLSVRAALADRNPEPSTALDRMLADPPRRAHEVDKTYDEKTDAWDRVGGDIVLTNPECRADKHDSCDGRGWNETRDRYEGCPCGCHKTHVGGRS